MCYYTAMSNIWNFIKGLAAIAAMAILFAIIMFFQGLKDMRDNIEDPLELHEAYNIDHGTLALQFIQIERRYGGIGNSVRFDVELVNTNEKTIQALLDPPSGSVFEIYAEREVYRFTPCVTEFPVNFYRFKVTATVLERNETDSYEEIGKLTYHDREYGDPDNNIRIEKNVAKRITEPPDTYALRPTIWGKMSPSGNISPRDIRAAEKINQQRDAEKSLINDEEMREDHVLKEDIKHIGAQAWTFLVIGVFIVGIFIKFGSAANEKMVSSAPQATEGLRVLCAIVAFPLMYYALGSTDLTWIGKGIGSLIAAGVAAGIGPGFLGACAIVLGLYYGWMILAWLLPAIWGLF